MKADYKNWVPKGMIYSLGAAAVGLAGAAAGVGLLGKSTVGTAASAVLGAGALGCGALPHGVSMPTGSFPTMGNVSCPSKSLLKTGSTFFICNESNGDTNKDDKWTEKIGGMIIYNGDQIRTALLQAGFTDIHTVS